MESPLLHAPFRGDGTASQRAEVLKQRSGDLPPVIQMCDALSRNVPKPVQTLVANCNAHGRRNFVKVTPNFPEPCRFVLETMREVYGHDAEARQRACRRRSGSSSIRSTVNR